MSELDKRGIAYLHVMRPFANQTDADVVGEARKHFSGNLIVCGGYDFQSGTDAVESGTAAAVAYGQLYIANPDLVARFKTGAALNTPNPDTFYSPGRDGYLDYPTLAQAG